MLFLFIWFYFILFWSCRYFVVVIFLCAERCLKQQPTPAANQLIVYFRYGGGGSALIGQKSD